MTQAYRPAARAVPVVLLAVLVVVAAAAPGGAASADQVVLRFDDGRLAAPFTSTANVGSLSARTSVAIVTDSAGAGRIVAVTSSPGQAMAADFPPYSAGGPRAVLVVRNVGGSDGMNPGSARLEFGADLLLDSGVTSGGSSDNGNNAVQRGLYDDRAQFKLEVDAGRPTCRVKGSGGAVQVTARTTMAPGARYRVRCLRAAAANTVSISVAAFAADGSLGATATTAASTPAGRALGSLTFVATVPLSVGGKAYVNAASGSPKLMAASDQFNGAIDNVVLRLG